MSQISCCTRISEYRDNRYINVCDDGTHSQLIVDMSPNDEKHRQISLWFEKGSYIAEAISKILQLEGQELDSKLETDEYKQIVSSKILNTSQTTTTLDTRGRMIAVGKTIKTGLISMVIADSMDKSILRQGENILLTLSQEQEAMDVRILIYFYVLQQGIIKQNRKR